jgi:hypothetical protein
MTASLTEGPADDKMAQDLSSPATNQWHVKLDASSVLPDPL